MLRWVLQLLTSDQRAEKQLFSFKAPCSTEPAMCPRRFFITYGLLSFFAVMTSGLLWRGLRPKDPVEPLCEKTHCPLGNQLACLIMDGVVYTECISQWSSCVLYWLPKCWPKRRWPRCKLTRYGCACRC
ncbi:uncharacterized protein LOC119374651 isoform X2 [Rhipicephalus sanguineus]|uniref:uncharacterized protein LOC119374651 isoform X2 n=1 Tax=Rhipicephalus sanguineus TaxID=34632 RepID=UPI001892D453|nr:uncharacterized protein LOC119374651 isoform X2 [Rhipicephalus sanguineus]